jgi:polysaccharide chain length determinant protein (PEP-CTERM system associated)
VIPGKQYTPELVLGIAWRRKWQILVPAVVIASIVAAATYNLPNLYRSDTLILVVPQRVPESYVRSTVTGNIEDRLRTISQQILSRTRLERIIQDFNLYAEERQTKIMEDVVNAMRDQIAIDIVRGDAFRVTFTGTEPRTTMQVTERLASLFIDENLRDREVLAEGTSQFLDSQLQDARRRLVENEQKLAQYRRQHDGQLPTQVEGNLQGLHNTEMQLQALLDSLNRDRDRHLVLERTLADLSNAEPEPVPSTPPPVLRPGEDPDAQVPAARQLETAEAALRGMLLRLTPEHPDVVRMRRTIAGLQTRVEAEANAAAAGAVPVSAPANPAETARVNRLRDTQSELERVAREVQLKQEAETRLHGVITQYQQRIEAAPGRESELAELMRDYSTLQETYSSLLKKQQDSQISANLERRQIGEQFRVLDPAQFPEKPASPNRPLVYLMGLAGALAVGLVLAGGAEYLDRGLRSEEDVRLALGLPVLAAIPLIPDAASSRRRRAKVAGSVAAVLVALGSVTSIAWRLLG